ncbi:MAG: hypothetical protein HIU92_09250 [Proteobacteria bacterium]|nr:hypothetical protein [Pseudomonadota bacterium]
MESDAFGSGIVFADGFFSATIGLTLTDNPHRNASASLVWRAGWHQAKADEAGGQLDQPPGPMQDRGDPQQPLPDLSE